MLIRRIERKSIKKKNVMTWWFYKYTEIKIEFDSVFASKFFFVIPWNHDRNEIWRKYLMIIFFNAMPSKGINNHVFLYVASNSYWNDCKILPPPKFIGRRTQMNTENSSYPTKQASSWFICLGPSLICLEVRNLCRVPKFDLVCQP